MQPAATSYLQKNGAQVREDKLRRDKQLRRKYSLPWPGPEGTISTMPSTSLLRQLSSTMVSDEGLVVMEIPVAADDDMGLTAPALLTHRLPGKSDVLLRYKSSGKIQEELKKKRSCALRTGLVKKKEDRYLPVFTE